MKFASLTILILSFSVQLKAQVNWSYLPNAPAEHIRYEDVFFVNDTVGWAASFQRIMKTTDGGQSWTIQLDTSTSDAGFRSIEFLNDQIGFSGALSNHLYKTIDGGLSWTTIDSLLPGPTNFKSICGMSHIGQTHVYAVGTWFQGGYFYSSSDGGQNWTYQDLSDSTVGLVECLFLDTLTGFASGRANDSLLDGIILRTTDGGSSWQTVYRTNRLGEYVWKLQFMNDTLGYASIQNVMNLDTSHMLKTTDGGLTWQKKVVTSLGIHEQGIGFIDDSTGWTGGYSYGMYKTTDGGDSWAYYNFGANLNRIFLVREGLAYGAGTSIYKWQEIQTGIFEPAPISDYRPNFLLPSFPNPSSKSMAISFQITETTNVLLSVLNAEGKLVGHLVTGYYHPGIFSVNWDCADNPDGTYLISLGTDQCYSVEKVIVSH